MSASHSLPLLPDDKLITALSQVLALEEARTGKKVPSHIQSIQFSKAYLKRLLEDWSVVLREEFQIDVATLPRVPGGIIWKKETDGSFQFLAVPRKKITRHLSQYPFYFLPVHGNEQNSPIPDEELQALAAALPDHAPIILRFGYPSYKIVIFGWIDQAWKRQTVEDGRSVIWLAQGMQSVIKYDAENREKEGYYRGNVPYLEKYHEFYKGKTLGRGGFGTVKEVRALSSLKEEVWASKTFLNSSDERFHLDHARQQSKYGDRYNNIYDARMQKELELECYFNSLLGRNATLVYKMKADGTLEKQPWRYLGNFLPGTSLSAIEALSLAEFYEISFKLFSAVQSLHQHPTGPILHRDIKPCNILFDRSGANRELHLIDLGLAMNAFTENFSFPQINEDDYSPDEGNTIYFFNKNRGVGTPEYRAPETLLKPPVYSTASDIYALGVTLKKIFEKVRGVSNTENKGVSLAENADLTELFSAMRQHDPSARPSIQALFSSLANIRDEQTVVLDRISSLHHSAPINDSHPHQDDLRALAARLHRNPLSLLDFPVAIIQTLPSFQFDLDSALASHLLLGFVRGLIATIQYKLLPAHYEGERLLDHFWKRLSAQKNLSLAWQNTLEFLQAYFFNPYLAKGGAEVSLAYALYMKQPSSLLLPNLLSELMCIVKAKGIIDDSLPPAEERLFRQLGYSLLPQARILSQPDHNYSADLERIFTALDPQCALGRRIRTILEEHQGHFYPHSPERQLLERLLKILTRPPVEETLKAPTESTQIKIRISKIGIGFFKKQLQQPRQPLAPLLPPADLPSP